MSKPSGEWWGAQVKLHVKPFQNPTGGRISELHSGNSVLYRDDKFSPRLIRYQLASSERVFYDFYFLLFVHWRRYRILVYEGK
jgi:hypothetical protein